MSRSRRKNPICGLFCPESNAAGKRRANKKLRRRNRSRLQATGDGDDLVGLRDVSSPYWFAKGGKHRFDDKEYPEGMRK